MITARRRLGLLASALLAAGATGCGDGGGDPPAAALDVAVTSTVPASRTPASQVVPNAPAPLPTAMPTTTTVTSTTSTASRKAKKHKPPPDTPPTTVAATDVGYQVIEWPPFTPAGPLDGIAALTGEPANPDVTMRAALAVKVDNTRPARPQWNIDAADVIFEENVEGITRFVAVFHSRLPSSVGPVRSARTSDLSILAAMNRPILAWSGGNAAVTAEVRAAVDAGVIIDLSALRVGCYQRHADRRAPHNLVLDPACAHARVLGAPARPLWSFDAGWEPGAAAYGPDSTFDVAMDGVRVTWQWDAGEQRYLRSQDGVAHVAANGNRIAVTNVVTMYVPHVASRADGRSPEAVTIGTGQVMVHRDGVATAGTWERGGPYDGFTFRDRDGRVIPLRPGTTFVQLARGG